MAQTTCSDSGFPTAQVFLDARDDFLRRGRLGEERITADHAGVFIDATRPWESTGVKREAFRSSDAAMGGEVTRPRNAGDGTSRLSLETVLTALRFLPGRVS